MAREWFALDSVYQETPRDSISEFLDEYTRGLIAHHFFRTRTAIEALSNVLTNYPEKLSQSERLTLALMLSSDLSGQGKNKQAGNILEQILKAERTHLSRAWISALTGYAGQYKELSGCNPYEIRVEGEQGCVPFRIVEVGNPEKKNVLMQLAESTINGVVAPITFDTGAGVNVISEEYARKMKLKPLKAHATLTGIGRQGARYAIADEVRLGNITIKNVPFYIADLRTDNEEANKYVECFSIIVGSELMIRLKDLTIDFTTNQISVAESHQAGVDDVRPNMCLSRSMNLLANGMVNSEKMRIKVDTGDASYGYLSGSYFGENREYVLSHSTPDTVRTAGIGGVRISECFQMPDVRLKLGGETVIVPEITVYKDSAPIESGDYECNLGLRSLMLVERVRLNFVDSVITLGK